MASWGKKLSYNFCEQCRRKEKDEVVSFQMPEEFLSGAIRREDPLSSFQISYMAKRILIGLKRSIESKGRASENHLCFVNSHTAEALFDILLLRYSGKEVRHGEGLLFSEDYRRKIGPGKQNQEGIAQKFALFSLRYPLITTDFSDPFLSEGDLKEAMNQRKKLMQGIRPNNFGVTWEAHGNDFKCPSTSALASFAKK